MLLVHIGIFLNKILQCICFIFFIFLKIYLKSRVIESERRKDRGSEREENLPFAGSFTNGHNGSEYVRPKSGVWHFL